MVLVAPDAETRLLFFRFELVTEDEAVSKVDADVEDFLEDVFRETVAAELPEEAPAARNGLFGSTQIIGAVGLNPWRPSSPSSKS